MRLTKIPYGINCKFLFLCDKLLGFIPKDGTLYVSIFDSKLNKEKTIIECDYWLDFTSNKRKNFFDRSSDTLLSAIQDNQIFLTRGDSQAVSIDRFDFNGNKLATITHNVEKIKISRSFIDRIHSHFRIKYRSKNSNYFIKTLNLPDYFPAVRELCAADHKLYVLTFKEEAGKTEVLVFSTSGEYLQKIFLPIKEASPERLFPFSISDNTFYQLVENEKNENWDLVVAPIK